jgi:hypothetical protein
LTNNSVIHTLCREHNLSVDRRLAEGKNTHVFDQNSQHVVGDEGRKRGSDTDSFEAERDAGEENCDGLLLEPEEDDAKRQVGDITLQSTGEGESDLNSGEGVVALTDI